MVKETCVLGLLALLILVPGSVFCEEESYRLELKYKKGQVLTYRNVSNLTVLSDTLSGGRVRGQSGRGSVRCGSL